LRPMTSIPRYWVTTGSVVKGMRIAGAWAVISWAVKFSIIGELVL
jgi:hypothetical protein